MKKRSFLIPVLLAAIIIAAVAFLIVALNQEPYEIAMQRAQKAEEQADFEKAISQYTIAQNLRPDEKEAYLKSMEAIAHAKSNTIVRDMLTTINECVAYCGDTSIEPSYVVYLTEIMQKEGQLQQAYDILSHLYYTLAESEEVRVRSYELEKLLNNTTTENENANLNLTSEAEDMENTVSVQPTEKSDKNSSTAKATQKPTYKKATPQKITAPKNEAETENEKESNSDEKEQTTDEKEKSEKDKNEKSEDISSTNSDEKPSPVLKPNETTDIKPSATPTEKKNDVFPISDDKQN